MRILYVEDDPHDADLTVRTLRKSAPHFHVESVATVGEALARLERIDRDPLDLVLTDMRLRDGDGLSLLQHIRESGLPLAVVLVTGMGDEETAVAALKARADDYVVKRKDYLDRLPVVLESALSHHRADAARRAHPLEVLYVEDDRRDAEETRHHLAVHADHLHLNTVFDGRDALSALRPEADGPRFDVFLLSLDLQEPNGLEVLWELRLKRRQDVPVVLVCRECDEDTARRALNLGASSYLVKRPGYLYQLPWELEGAYSRADLTRREAALQASEARTRAILNAIPDLMFLQSRDGTYLDYHAQHPDQLLSPPAQFLGKSMWDVLPRELAADFLRCFEQTWTTGRPVVHEYTLPMPDGAHAYEASIVSCNGDKILSIVRDVTERKRAEDALRESEEKYRTLFESIDEGFCVFDMIYDAEGRAVDFVFRVTNPAFDRLTGWHNAVGRRVRELLPSLEEVWLEKYGQVAATGEPQRFTEHAAGLNRWYEVYTFPVGDAASRTVAVLFSNVTERIRAEEAVRRNESVLTQAGQMASLGAWEVDLTHSDKLDENPHVWSEQVYRLFGYEPGSVEPSSGLFFRHVHPDDQPRIDEAIRAAITARKPYSMEYRIKRADGAERFIHGHALIDVDEAGRPRRLIGAIQDTTERKLAEEALKRALEEVRQLKDRLQEENIYLQQEVRVASNFGEIIGSSPALNLVLLEAEQVAATDTTVLILGETGTGKELLAHAIHHRSPRNRHPLVKVNCAALPAPLIESELFGHEKGAFTGAFAQRRGRFELADGGTIFLDEVGELPHDLQAKLLRVLEEGEFERVGGSRTLRVDVRVIAATNRRLEEAVQKGTFRSDLYYRLRVYPITLPPLRERREDIPVLVTHFVKTLGTKMGKEIETIPQHAMNALQNYSWPGNIREMRNVIERAVIITQGATLRLTDDMRPQPSGEGAQTPGVPFDAQPARYPATETLEQSEYNLILRTLRRVNWKIEGPGGAAELLDINPSTLRTRMKKLGISKP